MGAVINSNYTVGLWGEIQCESLLHSKRLISFQTTASLDPRWTSSCLLMKVQGRPKTSTSTTNSINVAHFSRGLASGSLSSWPDRAHHQVEEAGAAIPVGIARVKRGAGVPLFSKPHWPSHPDLQSSPHCLFEGPAPLWAKATMSPGQAGEGSLPTTALPLKTASRST